MMLPKRDENVILSIRNIPTAKAQHVASINVVELLKHDCLIMPVKTVRWLEMVFGEGLSAEEATSRLAIALESEATAASTEETNVASDEPVSDTEETNAASDEPVSDEETTTETTTGENEEA